MTPIRCAAEHGGQLQRIVLDRPRANVLDGEMLAAVTGRVRELAGDPGPLKLLVFEGSGENFSYGASVAEHMPEQVETMLRGFHGLFFELERLGVPTAALVRGQCLGGAFELAVWCGMVFCDPTARFGVPEVKLGVFPPVAAIALPWRVPGARAAQLILSGETLEGEAAARLGVADRCAEDPEAALQAWFSEVLAEKSAVALKTACRASRRLLANALRNDIPYLEDLYLKDLMSHRDPVEGLSAFLERRKPVWTNQ